jgi:hypothetical protein
MKRHISRTDREKLEAEISSLTDLDNNELKARWKSLYDTEAPVRMKRELLRYAVAHRMQERVLGGVKPATCRLLDRIADHAGARNPVKVSVGRKAGKGTILIRNWGGVDHQVEILEKGVLLAGKRYRSLSEVARVITGSHWSGPLFFGLKAQEQKEAVNGAR